MAYRAAICDDCAADAQFVSEILRLHSTTPNPLKYKENR